MGKQTIQINENDIKKIVTECVRKVLKESANSYLDDIPKSAGEFEEIYNKEINYRYFSYFGNCVNSVNVFNDATEMAQFINGCPIINDITEVIGKLRNGDRPMPKELANNIQKLISTNNINNKSEVVAGISDYQKILWIYLYKTDKHYFFDCEN